MTTADDLRDLDLPGPRPVQIVRLDALWLTELLARAGERGFEVVPCDATTEPGDRLALLEHGTSRGIVALADVHTAPEPSEVGGSAVWVVITELVAPITRAELAAAGLHAVARRAQPACVLREMEQERLAAALDPLPRFTTNSDPLPTGVAALELLRFEEGELWKSERELQLALAADPEALHALGLPDPPRVEERFDGGRMRFDLSGPGTIVECKLFGTVAGVEQLARYLAAVRGSRGGEWRGVLAVGLGYVRDVGTLVAALEAEAEATRTSPEIELVLCHRRRDGGVHLLYQSEWSVPAPTLVEHLRREFEATLPVVTQFLHDAVELAVVAGLDDDDVDEIDAQTEARIAVHDFSLLDAVTDTGPPSDRAGIALGQVLLQTRLFESSLIGLAEEAGLDDATIDALLQQAADLQMEPAGSPTETLESIVATWALMRPQLMTLANACGVRHSEFRRVHEAYEAREASAGLSAPAACFLGAKLANDGVLDAARALARAAGVSERSIRAILDAAQ